MAPKKPKKEIVYTMSDMRPALKLEKNQKIVKKSADLSVSVDSKIEGANKEKENQTFSGSDSNFSGEDPVLQETFSQEKKELQAFLQNKRSFLKVEPKIFYTQPSGSFKKSVLKQKTKFSPSDFNWGVIVPEEKEEEKSFWKSALSNYRKLALSPSDWLSSVGRPVFLFGATAVVTISLFVFATYLSDAYQIKNNVQVLGQQAIGNLEMAKQGLENRDFGLADSNFDQAVENFSQAQSQIDMLGGNALDLFSKLPVVSRISSGKNVVFAGNELTKSAKEMAAALEVLSVIDNPLDEGNEDATSLIEVFEKIDHHASEGKKHLHEAQGYIEKVKTGDLPVEYQDEFTKIKELLPLVILSIESFDQHSQIFLELLGHNGPRKYLLLFQNNQEARATGGFIGSYGLIHIADGHVKKILIEGIFNPDGQFREDIIPPRPLQKITAGWSTHDANWFPHFPRSAAKISEFYEKTGGPTVDGIITLTPEVMIKFLEITGPIEMDEYDVIVTSENFVEKTQNKVEDDFDRNENQPKKFLADLAPEILNRIFSVSDPAAASKVLKTLSGSLKEKHILLYSTEEEVQTVISDQGWAGELLETKKDYFQVVNTNINGFKTDGVIDQEISHSAQIGADGTITVTLAIKRVHNGGDTKFDWWNEVNSNYQRVYVPKGSKLISASGHTRQFIEQPLDYEKLGFRVDEEIAAQEKSMKIDEETGTRVYEEDEKTVFANWTYVSPKETVEIEYVYQLPFKLEFSKNKEGLDSYSLLAQKQSGSRESKFSSKVKFSDKEKVLWKHPGELQTSDQEALLEADLSVDRFLGIVLQKKKE